MLFLCVIFDYASCPVTGRIKRRAGPMETALRRVLREAGARVVPNARLRDLGVRDAPRQDDRNIEAAAFGLPLHHGVPLLVDITMSSPLHADGTPIRGAAATDGVAIAAAENRKAARYPEQVQNWSWLLARLVGDGASRRCRLSRSWRLPKQG